MIYNWIFKTKVYSPFEFVIAASVGSLTVLLLSSISYC